mgnify:CR=1 FL=1
MVAERGVISYPTPIFQNLPIRADFYQPSVFNISAITLGLTTTVTTSVAHNYVIGQEVRLLIPPSFGSRQLNNKKAFVITIPSNTQVELRLNSQFVDAFILASSNIQVAQILAIGDINNGQVNANVQDQATNIPGSFINISP